MNENGNVESPATGLLPVESALDKGGGPQLPRKFTDLRTVEGKWLAGVLDDITRDLGGPAELTAGQKLLLDALKSKLIVLRVIADFVDTKKSILDRRKGRLLPVLRDSFLQYQESARKDIEALYGVYKSKTRKAPDLKEYLRGKANG